MVFTLYDGGQMKMTSEKIGYETFYIKNKNSEDLSYDIPIRFMNNIFSVPRGELESKLDEINPKIVESLKKENISIDSTHLVMCLATNHSCELVRQDRGSGGLGSIHFSD